MKKFLVAGVALLLSLGLSGCGSGNKDDADGGKDGKVKEITYWHYATDRKKFFEDVAKDYEKENGVKVNIQIIGGDTFQNKIQSAIQGDDLPNVWMFTGGKSDLSTFAENKYIAKLDDFKKDFGNYDELALKQVSFAENEDFKMKEGTYGVPLDMNNIQIIYNKDLFKKAGLDPEKTPTTWEEFLEVGSKLEEAGVTPFTSGFGSWTQFSFTEQYQFAYNTPEELTEVRTGKKTFKEGHFDKVFQLVDDMREKKMFMQGIGTMDLPAAEAAFANNQVAMLYDGSWAINVLTDLNPELDLDNLGVMMPPPAEGTTKETAIPGGVGAWLVASGKQSDAELKESARFMEFLTNKENQIKYANESSNIPANKDAIDLDKLNPMLAKFYEGMQYVQPSVPGYDPVEIQDLYGKGVQAVILGEKTPEQVVEELDKAR